MPKVYDITNCLNKNLKTYFVGYIEKEIRADIFLKNCYFPAPWKTNPMLITAL